MYTIMIVDDEPMSSGILKKYIDTQVPNYDVTGVYCNGVQALEAFHKAPTDIVLLDILMPVMNGLELVEELNKLKLDYVPIIVSGYGEFKYAITAMKLGVIHYLLKPVDFDELERSLEAAAQTLQFRKLTHASLTMQDDEQEMFLIDVMTGRYQEREEAMALFSELNFPFSYNECQGIILLINFLSIDGGSYGRDALVTAVGNLIHINGNPDYILPFLRKNNCCDYLIINIHNEDETLRTLAEQAKSLLKTDISVEPVFRFTTIDHLRTRQWRSGSPLPENIPIPEENDFTIIELRIQSAIAYMEEHCGEDLTREDVADKVYMSGAYFSRCFKMVTNMTYKDYLTEIRMQKAIELLKTNAKITDIARRVGYPNSNRFNINFRNYTSYTPSEYRIKVLKQL